MKRNGWHCGMPFQGDAAIGHIGPRAVPSATMANSLSGCGRLDAKQIRASSRRPRIKGFTLIELLVVIGVIAILAGMVVGGMSLATRNKLDRRVTAELEQLQLAIDAYKAKKGFYPPSNAQDVSKPPLYFELLGTFKEGNEFKTWNGSASILVTDIPNKYGANISGFINAGAKNDPDAPPVENFHKNLKTAQVKDFDGAPYLGVPYRGPDGPDFNRWRYNSLNPTNNPESYDLWIELNEGSNVRTFGNFGTKDN